MSLFAIRGYPKNGKTYEAVKNHILPAVKDGRMVVTNIALNMDHFKLMFGDEVENILIIVDFDMHAYGEKDRPFSTPEWFLKYDHVDKKNRAPYFIIDEAHLCFAQDTYPKEIHEFMTAHGHYGYDILLLTQSTDFLARPLKKLVQLTFQCTKLTVKGEPNHYIRKTCLGVTNKFEKDQVLQTKYDPQIFAYYQAHTKRSGMMEEVSPSGIKAKPNKFKRIGYSTAGFVCLMLVMMITNLFKSDDVIASTATETQISDDVLTVEKAKEIVAVPNAQMTKVIIDKSQSYHPYSKLELYISGHYVQSYKGRRIKIFSFGALKKGREIFKLSDEDILRAGYDLQILNDCLAKVTYYEYEQYLTCDKPDLFSKKRDIELLSMK